MKKLTYMPRVIEAEYLKDYRIKVKFTNGLIKEIDCEKYIDGGIFEKIKDREVFKNFFIDGWTISWPNGADIAPDTLYNED